MTAFTRFAAIDWSGARGIAHRGIAVAQCASGDAAPRLVPPPGRVWARRDVLDWICAQAADPVLIGMDFSFSAPFVGRGAYLPGESIAGSARDLWAYVDRAARDDDLGAASFLEARRGAHFYFGAADGKKRDFMHYRVCEQRYNALGGGKASTVYDAIGAAQVAKSSFAGMRLLHHLGNAMPVWPFDAVPARGALLVEIYTTIAARAAGVPKGRSKITGPAALDAALTHPAIASLPHVALDSYDSHTTDAVLTAAWLRRHAPQPELWRPALLNDEIAQCEGWTFGVV